MLKFEMCTPQMFLVWLLSRDSGISFTEAQQGSILTALCSVIAYLVFTTGKNLVNTSSDQNKFGGNCKFKFFQIKTIKSNFQRPSSSELYLPL